MTDSNQLIKTNTYRNKLLIFFAIAYFILWIVDLPIYLIGTVIGENFVYHLLVHIPGFGPLVGAIIVIWKFENDEAKDVYKARLTNFKIHPMWYVISFVIPFGTYFILRLIQISVGNKSSFVEVGFFNLGGWLILSILLSGIKEEPGWRGYAVPKFLEKYDAVFTSIVIGTIWAFWHLLLYVFGSRPIEQFPQFVFTLIALSFIYTWIYIQTESVPLVALLHIFHNFAVFMLLDLDGPITFWNAGGLVYALIAFTIILFFGPSMDRKTIFQRKE